MIERGREREEGKMHSSYKQNCLSIHIIKMKIIISVIAVKLSKTSTR